MSWREFIREFLNGLNQLGYDLGLTGDRTSVAEMVARVVFDL